MALTLLPQTNGVVEIFSRSPDRPATNRYQIGDVFFARAIPDSGYAFAGWSGDLSGVENPIAVTLDRSKQFSAKFAPGYTVTMVQNDGGVINYSSRKVVYGPGTILDLQAVPAAGYEFAGWSGALQSTSPTIEITVNQNTSLFARFRSRVASSLWSYTSPSSAVIDPVIDTNGFVYMADQRGIISLDTNGNLQWRTLTADGTSYTNLHLAVEPSGNLRALTVAIPAGSAGASLKRITPDGDLLGGSVSLSRFFNALAIGLDNRVYVSGQGLDAFSPAGATLWEVGGPSFDQRYTRAAIDHSGRIFAVATHPTLSSSNYVAAMTSNNVPLWKVPLRVASAWSGAQTAVLDYTGTTYPLDQSPIIGGGHVFIVDSDGSLLSLNLDGSIAWRFTTLDVFSVPSMGADGALYFGARNSNRFYALNGDGSVRWVKRPGLGSYNVPAIGSDGTIYVSDSAGLYALNANGDRIWEFDQAVGSPVIDGNRVFVTGGSLYALAATANGAATSPWPMRNASAQNDAVALNPPSAPPTIDVSRVGYTAGVFTLHAKVQPGATVTLFVSDDLIHWTPLKTQSALSQAIDLTDDTPSAHSHFYQISQQ